MRTRIKICGLTQVDNAVAVAKMGIDAIGLVFYRPSPRYIKLAQATAIAQAMPAFMSMVALFVNAKQRFIEQVLTQVPIDLIQFHGDECAHFCRKFGKPYIKAVAMKGGVDLDALSTQHYSASGLLLDTYDATAKGGSGNCFNWQLLPKKCALPIILAGGLKPQNARHAIQQVKPYAIDVSSGVESKKGIKDTEKIAALIAEVGLGDKDN